MTVPGPLFFFHEIVFNQRPPVSIPLSVDSLPGPVRLRGDLVGMTEAPEVPRDHHVRIRLNGSQVYEGFFKGTESHRFDVPAGSEHSMADQLLGMAVHDGYHAGQIKLLSLELAAE